MMSDALLQPRETAADSISVFFPCYNEQDNLRRVYESATKALGRLALDYELIIIDDGSRDQTPAIADSIAASDPRVAVIHHPGNQGYGAALRSGFRAASRPLVFFTDGDGQFDLNELPPLLPLMRQYDLVAGFRLHRQEGLIRRCNSWCWTALVCLVFRLRLKDVNCAFKLCKKEVVDASQLLSTGALINAEILARAAKGGYAVTQVGVHHYPRVGGRPTGASVKVVLRAFKELLALHRQIKGPAPR